jgi:hypothetical protein
MAGLGSGNPEAEAEAEAEGAEPGRGVAVQPMESSAIPPVRAGLAHPVVGRWLLHPVFATVLGTANADDWPKA